MSESAVRIAVINSGAVSSATAYQRTPTRQRNNCDAGRAGHPAIGEGDHQDACQGGTGSTDDQAKNMSGSESAKVSAHRRCPGRHGTGGDESEAPWTQCEREHQRDVGQHRVPLDESTKDVCCVVSMV